MSVSRQFSFVQPLKSLGLVGLLLLAITSCEKGEEAPGESPPSNLLLTATIATDGSGKVAFQASADNASSFDFYFGELSMPAVTSTDGKAEYTYSSSGTYTAKVIAFNAARLFAEKSVEVVVTVNEIVNPVGYTTPESYAGLSLVWQDEFSGTSLNENFWTHEIGTGCPNCGWGNNELEYYQPKNTSVADGYLTIRAKKEPMGGMSYTSSRIITKGKKSFKFGRVDIRALLPKGQGIWPALWMLGTNISTVGWPKCGEIDIMEMIGGGPGRDNRTYGTAHWDQAGYKTNGGNYTLTDGKNLSDQFHVFSIVWDATSIKWYIDDILYHTLDTTSGEMDEFRNEFFFIINVAVGGNWPGSPDATTLFPQKLIVDYIRVFQ